MIIIGGAVVAFNIFKPQKYDIITSTSGFHIFRSSKSNNTIILQNGKKQISFDEMYYDYATSMDQTKIGLLIPENNINDSETYVQSSNTLYMFDGNLKQISENVDSFCLSNNGKGMLIYVMLKMIWERCVIILTENLQR